MSTRPDVPAPLRDPFRRIEAAWQEVAAVIALGEPVLSLRAANVSGWSVAEQVDHLLKTDHSITSHLLTRTPAPGPTNSLVGRIVLATGFIPRGTAEAPKRLRGLPAGQAELSASLDRCRESFRRLAAEPEPLLAPGPVLPHKMFGALTALEALRFVPIHSRHHLKIVADIRRVAGR